MQIKRTLGLLAAAFAVAAGSSQAQTYSNAVAALNPAGYWPLTETTTPPSGDYVATNLGTLGAVGNGFYQSWYQPSGTSFYATNSVLRTTGPIGDGTAAMQCTYSNGPGTYVVFPRFTNGVANAALTIQPPFSIELWANPAVTNLGLLPLVTEGRNSVQGDASNGYASAFAGFSLGTYKNYFYFQLYNTNANSNAGEPELDIHGLNPGTWYHVVVTFDGTTVTMYSNSVAIGSATPPKNAAGLNFVPDLVSPLLIGTGPEISAGGGTTYYGGIDEVAIYPTALDPSAIQNHYNAASATDSSYQNAVLADNPSIYLRLDEPPKTDYPSPSTYPVANNYGSLGAAANGAYQPGTAPGVAGPSFPGFGPDSRAVALNGYYGTVDVGGGAVPTELNPSNSQPFTVTAWFQGNPADCRARFQNILGHTDAGWRVTLDTASGVRFNPGPGPELQFANVSDVLNNGFLVNDGKWHFVAAVCDGTNEALYVDGALAKTNTAAVKPIVGSASDVFLGGDPQYVTPVYNSGHIRNFDGQVAQVAFFSQPLSEAQVQQLYSAAGVPPSIAQQPAGASGNAGDTLSFSVGVRGSSPLSYQWYQNGGPVTGATDASLAFAPLAPGNAGTYYVVVTNSYGSATSAPVQLTVYSTPVLQEQTTTTVQIFAGANPTLHARAIGPSLTYQWTLNGSDLSGATSSAYTITNIQTGGTYGCTIANSYGSTALSPISVSVLTDPTAPFPSAVLSDNPLAYYRLDEASGTTAFDYSGGLNLTYTNVQLGQPGYSANADPSEKSAGFGFVTYDGSHYDNNYAGNGPSFLNFGSPTNTSVAFSLEAWVNATTPQTTDAGVITLGYGNGGEQFNLDCGASDPAHNFRFFVRDSSGAVHAVNSSFAPTDGNWHHVAAVCDEPHGQVRLYVDGKLSGSSTIVTNSGLLKSSSSLSIGSRQSGQTTGYDNQFLGMIDDVAVYGYALSSSQVLAHYYGGGIVPAITLQPTNTTANEGSTVTFSVSATGSPPLAYQWYDLTSGTAVPLAGKTSSSLVLGNVSLSANGNVYEVIVTNAYGQVTSDPVQLTVLAGPPIVQQDITPTFQMVNEGTMLSFSVDVTGSAPLHYQWLQNGIAIPSATNDTYSFEAVVGTNVYRVTISNNNGSTDSSDATVVGLAVPKLTPSDYSHHMTIAFSGYNRGELLTNFPALVLIGTNLPGFSYSQLASPDGGDLRFTDSSGTRIIPHEIDEWNPDGVSSIWVQVPHLSSTNDFIYAYWGDPAATTPPITSTNGAVWQPQYDLVYHLKESALPFLDSTLQFPATNGVAPTPIPGMVGTAGAFGGTAWLDAGVVNLGDAFTLSSWINIDPSANNIETIWASQPGGYAKPGFALFVNTYQTSNGKVDMSTGDGSNGHETTTASGTISFGQWHQLAVSVDRTAGTVLFYVDGALVPSDSGTVVSTFPNDIDLNLGRFADGAFDLNGAMDETRVKQGTNTLNSIWADYMTVAQNSTFQSYSGISGTGGSSVTLQYQVSGGNLILTWPAGTLQIASEPGGPYVDNTSAKSPYQVPLSGGPQFFRVRVQ